MAAGSLAAEHAELLQAAIDVTADVATARERLHSVGDVTYEQHMRFGERLWSLHTYLQGVLVELDHDLYLPAFANLRTALEHHVQDHLLFLGNRYRAIVSDVSDETFAEWQSAIDEKRRDFAGIVELRHVGPSQVEVIRSGPHYTGGEQGLGAPGLSIYYQIIADFDPLTGGKRAQDFIGQWPHAEDARHRWAAQAAETWGRFFSWRQLLANLLLNEFYTERELARFEVHFGFLSAFTHPSRRGLEIVYGRNLPTRLRYDHYASELILLYIITIARLELEVFKEMTRREPKVDLVGWDGVRADMERGEALASHLWFPQGSPHFYDRVQEANRRGQGRDGRPVRWDERPRPEDLSDEEVLYYSNPLRRIIALHAGENELTGFSFIPAWMRSDARQRGMD
ncbi:MAG: hypothetical protein M3P26_04270 [Gemmatimonadota bacterium]|nr:hypothetical protein [Gemmatimonadota bacterium]